MPESVAVVSTAPKTSSVPVEPSSAPWGSRLIQDGAAIEFRVSAPSATRVELWIYATPIGASILQRPMTAATGIFSLELDLATLKQQGLQDDIFYGYRVWGPNWAFDPTWQPGSQAGFLSDCDSAANRFNPNKLLIDPYALEVSHDPLTPGHTDMTMYESGPQFRQIDTGPFAPKSIVLDLASLDFGVKPQRAFKDDVIYEVHLRGLTKNDPTVPAALQGTYAGAALRANYLRDLGITVVEFLPIHETQNSLNDDAALAALHNYWGYDSFSYFAPDRRYASDQAPGGPTREWIAMVKAFHDAGLKVYVDVVYNHFDESDVDALTGQVGEIFSLRGLDNSGYFEIASLTDPLHYTNDNGVGPNLNAASSPARDLVMASLSYWVNTMGVDGFRFDLAAVLGNSLADGGYSFNPNDPNNILNRAVQELPARPPGGGAGVDLIAEPYTATGGGQEQGDFPVGWAEWNDRYRDTFRASQNKLGFVSVTPGAMATRLAGSSDLFQANGRKPWSSVNYITCHDGLTLRDLYSFSEIFNNQPFPFGPSSGGRSAADEMCWDHGGDVVQQLQAQRAGIALLLLSAGVPMLLGGSEIGRTQAGNNNSFNLDTVSNWFDWPNAGQFADLTTFTQRLLLFRGAHPCLRPSDFFTGTDRGGQGIKDLTWYTNLGNEADQGYFTDPTNHFLAYRLDGAVEADSAASVYVAYNGWDQPINLNLPPARQGKSWSLVADTSSQAVVPQNIAPAGQEVPVPNAAYVIQGRSVLLLLEG